MGDKGKKLLRYWSWVGIGIFVGVTSLLYYLYLKEILDDTTSLLIGGLIFAALLVLTGGFKILWEYKDEKQVTEEKTDSNLELEYKELTEAIRHRGSQYLTLESILVSGAVVAVAALISTSDPNGIKSFIARGTLVAAILMIAIGWIFHFTTSNLDEIYWTRVHDIEKQLGIQGHRMLYKEAIKKKWWFKLRKKSWQFIYPLLTFMFLLGLAYSFNLIPFPFLHF